MYIGKNAQNLKKLKNSSPCFMFIEFELWMWRKDSVASMRPLRPQPSFPVIHGLGADNFSDNISHTIPHNINPNISQNTFS